MHRHISHFLTILLIVLSPITNAQSISGNLGVLDSLEQQLFKGDYNALVELGKILDSKEEAVDYLGWHRIETFEFAIAGRIIEENTSFQPSELVIDDKLRYSKFKTFLDSNNVVFSEIGQVFVATPFAEREVKVEFRALSNQQLKSLQDDEETLLNYDWIDTELRALLDNHDPKALVEIAGKFYRQRSRWNRYHFHLYEYTNLMRYLTKVDLGVINNEGELTFQMEEEYSGAAFENYLVYWASHYHLYKWDKRSNAFSRGPVELKRLSEEEKLFQLLNNDDDSIAMAAYRKLTEGDVEEVTRLAGQYRSYDIDHNWAIGIFPYRFLKQAVLFTAYCRNAQIEYKPDPALEAKFLRLSQDLPFADRRVLEDQLASTLTFEQITMLEYYGLLGEANWGSTYSVGRILDKFYSKHLAEIVTNKKQLECYLKKSTLFDRLGIIGVCNLYHVKFKNASPEMREILEQFQSDDPDIIEAKERALKEAGKEVKPPKFTYEWSGNKDFARQDAFKRYNQLYKTWTDLELDETQLNIDWQAYVASDDTMPFQFAQYQEIEDNEIRNPLQDSFEDFTSEIHYDQIGTAMIFMENFTARYNRSPWSFIAHDFGIPVENIGDRTVRKEFLRLYYTKSEYEIYDYYLSQITTDYKNADGTLNYNYIYEILKYDLVDAFVGGGGGRRENECYPIIKLLELKFETTLGFPKRFCNRFGSYGCTSDDRAFAWIDFLLQQGLITNYGEDGPSFGGVR